SECLLKSVSNIDFNPIFQKAESIGWQLCPLELAVYLRLQWQGQEKSTNNILHKHEAPQDAVTVASPVIDPDPNHPKGFYLRNIDGQLWLRGYICDDEYVFFIQRIDLPLAVGNREQRINGFRD
ncbi:hypothetical protein, partial [Lacticaseibacillus paracasei]